MSLVFLFLVVLFERKPLVAIPQSCMFNLFHNSLVAAFCASNRIFPQSRLTLYYIRDFIVSQIELMIPFLSEFCG